MSIKNPCSCAQANKMRKMAQIDDSDDCMVRSPFSLLTSSYQPFQPSEKETDPGLAENDPTLT